MSNSIDFDFLHGAWNVAHAKLRSRLTGSDEWDQFAGTVTCLPTRAGLGNADDNWLLDPGGAYGAIAMRSFDPVDRLWSIWWLDLRHPRRLDPPVVGRFCDGVGTFDADDVLDGRPIVVRFTWADTDTPNPRWEQACSPDEGRTWEVNWRMSFHRPSR